MTPLRSLVDFRIAPPATWAAVPAKPDDNPWPIAVAERLCDDPDIRRTLAGRLAASHADVIHGDPHVLVAVWVPDRNVPEVLGILAVDWILPDDGRLLSPDYYRGLLESTVRRDTEVYERHIGNVDLPAGPALRVHERIGRAAGGRFSRRRIVQENVIFTVFPPESSDALQLSFSTPALDLGPALATDAEATALTLEIDLEDPA